MSDTSPTHQVRTRRLLLLLALATSAFLLLVFLQGATFGLHFFPEIGGSQDVWFTTRSPLAGGLFFMLFFFPCALAAGTATVWWIGRKALSKRQSGSLALLLVACLVGTYYQLRIFVPFLVRVWHEHPGR